MKKFSSYISERKYADREKQPKLSGGKSNIKINPDSENLKEADIKPPMEKLKTDRNMFSIPADDREAAKARLLAKTAAKRKEMEKVKEELEIEEGMSLKDYKKKRSAVKQKEKRAADKIAPNRRKDIHTDRYSPERAARHRANVDPDFEGDDEKNYPGGKLKNPKKIRKAKALGELGEMLTFSQFMEARRMDKEGVDRGDSKRAERAEKAKASLAARAKRQKVLDKHEKQTGTKLDISKSKEGKEHAKNFPGSRQEPKVKGAKETALQTQNRRANRHNQRVMKHGFTSKEKSDNAAMAKHTSRFD